MSPYDGEMLASYPALIGPARRITMREIIAMVAERNDVTVEDLKGPERRRWASWPRQEAMAKLYAEGRWSRGQIGRALNRTCWTVTHGVAEYEAREAASSTGEHEGGDDLSTGVVHTFPSAQARSDSYA